MRDLFGLGLIEKHLAWYLIHGRLSARSAPSRSPTTSRPAAAARPRRTLRIWSTAFELTPEHLARTDRGRRRGRSARTRLRAYYAQQRAAGTLPVEEKTLREKEATGFMLRRDVLDGILERPDRSGVPPLGAPARKLIPRRQGPRIRPRPQIGALAEKRLTRYALN